MDDQKKLFKLFGKVQHYSWGGHSFIKELLQLPGEVEKPIAEYWLGAHDNYPGEIDGADQPLLNEYIKLHQEVLGEKVLSDFHRLPYLLKVLDVKDMLSIQVHPSREAALREFEEENRAGIPLNAPHRNYKDNNHKPELMVALSDFWLLHGFKHPEAIKDCIRVTPEFSFMAELFQEGRYQQLYGRLMGMGQGEVNSVLQPVLDRIIPQYQNNQLRKESAHFWAARAALTFNEPGKIDRGIFSIYLLNLVNLKPGEAIFQDAGLLHAYLEGQNIEIMANSDNVLRGGLTSKHIDTNELMKHVNFAPITPTVVYGTRKSSFEEVYVSPAADFQLSRLQLIENEKAVTRSTTTEIFLVIDGQVTFHEEGGGALPLAKGEAAVVFAGASLLMEATDGATLFRAGVPNTAAE